jgi:hypothetical protein
MSLRSAIFLVRGQVHHRDEYQIHPILKHGLTRRLEGYTS